jgi:hypothetical protein
MGVPGSVFVNGGGDFIGECRAGSELSAVDRAMAIVREEERRRFKRAHFHQIGSFTSLSALITAATAGKQCRMLFNKTSNNVTAIACTADLFGVGTQPASGTSGAAAPGGTAYTNSSTGSLAFVNAVSNANTSHFVNAWIAGTGASSVLLVDRLFGVAKTMNSTATEAVTGTFARYQSTIATAANYAGGTFCYPRAYSTVLASTAHNWTVTTYTNQAGTAAQSMPSQAGLATGPVNGQIDLTAGQWFLPLAAGDVGLQVLTQMQCSALVATGVLDFVVAHPIAALPSPIVNIVSNIDGVASAFNLVTVFDNACLSLLELTKPSTAGVTFNGWIATVSE